MKKLFSIILIAFFILGNAYAQSGKNQIGVSAEVGFLTQSGGGTYFGGSARYMHGVGTAGQVTFSPSYLVKSKTTGTYKQTWAELAFLLGYRHHFSGLFVEPQVGYASDKATFTNNGVSSVGYPVTDGSFAYAIGAGYAMPAGFEAKVRFQNTAQSGSVGLIILGLGWNFNLSGGSTSK